MIRAFFLAFGILLMPRCIFADTLGDALSRLASQLAQTVPQSQRPLTVAVLLFDSKSAFDGQKHADGLAGALARSPNIFRVVDRNSARMKDAIEELDFGLTDYVDRNTAAAFGKIVGAHALVYGRSEKDAQNERLSAWIYLIETGERLPVVYAQYRHTKPAASGALRSALIPGWGQWSLGRKGSGAFFLISSVGLGAGAFYASSQASNALDDAYLAGTIAERDHLLDDERSWKDRRNLLLAGLGTVWLSNILHAAWISSHTPVYSTFDGQEAEMGVALEF